MESLRRINQASGVPPFETHRPLLGPAFAHTAVGLAIADLQGNIVEANSAFLDIVGRNFSELSCETVESITHPDDREANAAAYRTLQTGEIPDFQIEKRYCRPDGAVVWVRNSLSLLCDSEGEPMYVIAISENINDRRRAEEASSHARETLAIATEAGGVGIWDVDMITGHMTWSSICRDIFGVPHGVALTLDDFYVGLHADDRERLKDIIMRVADPDIREIYDAQYRIVRPSGELRWAHATGRSYFERDPSSGQDRCVRFVGAIRDITEQRKSIGALIQAEKLAATGRLAASIAHEINNPLEAVTNLLFLLRDSKEADERNAYLALAEEEIKRVSEICMQTLRFYRDPSGPAPCDLDTMLNSVLSVFNGRLHLLNIEPETRLSAAGSVFGSQGELRQVFVNFVSNALDAMPNGGRLLLRVRSTSATRRGTYVTVADSGEGMSPETLRRIFQPFFTTKTATGTGLGLWLSLEILNKHGASVSVRSQVGKGTAIRVFFPE
jgi:PAS domain S-box-containing protein